MKITYRKITQAELDRAEKRLADKIANRALRKYVHKVKDSGASFSGVFDSFSDFDADQLSVESFIEEMSGLPMPPELPGELGALDGWIKKIKDKFNKASHKLAKAVHKTMKKIGPALVGMVVGMIAGPAAGPLIAKAMGSVASKYIGKKVQASQLQKMISKMQVKAAKAASDAAHLLPIGVSPDQARTMGEGKIPTGLGEEKTWHAIEQAKLIANNNIAPLDAYILHYHTYQQDAPPVTYTPPEVWDLIEKLKYIRGLVEKSTTIDAESIAEINKDSVYKKYFPNGLSALAPRKTFRELIAVSDPCLERNRWSPEAVKARNSGMTCEQYMASQRLIDSRITRGNNLAELDQAINRLRMVTETFPGAKYVPDPDAAPEPPIVTGGVKAVKEETVKTALSPDVTEKVMAQAKEELKKQNIDVESPEANELLKLQIEKLQQDVAQAVAQGRQIIVQPASPQPEIIVKETDEGKTVAVKQESSMVPLLLGAGALLLALKGG